MSRDIIPKEYQINGLIDGITVKHGAMVIQTDSELSPIDGHLVIDFDTVCTIMYQLLGTKDYNRLSNYKYGSKHITLFGKEVTTIDDNILELFEDVFIHKEYTLEQELERLTKWEKSNEK